MADIPNAAKSEFQQLWEVTPEQIDKTYRNGYITAAQKNDIMRRKAEAEVQKIVGDKGPLMAYWTQTIKHLQANWDDFVKLASDPNFDVTESSMDNLRRTGRAIMDQVGLISAPVTAFGEVNGAYTSMLAMKAGASPGLAKVIGTVVDVGSGFIPVGQTARLFAKGVQSTAPKLAAGLSKLSKAGATASTASTAETVAKAAAKKADDFIDEVIGKGLKADGVQGLERFVTEATDTTGKLAAPAAETLPVKDAFVKALTKFRAVMKGITETKTHEMTAKEAEKLGLTVEQLKELPLFKNLNENEMYGYLKALDEPVNDLISWAKKTLAGEEGAGETMSKRLMEFLDYSPKFRASEVTAGRAVEILKETPPMKKLTDLFTGWTPEAMAKLDPQAAQKIIAQDILRAAAEPGKLKALQVAGATEGTTGPTLWAKIREGYVNLLLARPVSQARNFLGNVYAASDAMVTRELAGWMSIDKANGAVRGEGFKMAQGYLAGMGDGLAAFGKAYGGDAAAMSKLDFRGHAIGGTLGNIINLPGDTMGGMDGFFKAFLTRGELYAQASREAIRSGLSGKKLADYVTARVNLPGELMDVAKDFALKNTFQNDLGHIGERMRQLTQGGQYNPLFLFFPFMKTPVNLMKFAWNRTPGLQLLSKSLYDDILAGGVRADEAIARLTLSSMSGMFFYQLAQNGLITGGGPADPTLRRSWLSTKQPYSFMVPGGSYQFNNFEPLSTQLAMIADFAEVHNQLDDPTADQTAMAIALSGTRDVVDKSYWQTVGQMVDFMGSIRSGEEPGRKAMDLIRSPLLTATGVGSPLVSSIARVEDPVRREARDFVDQILARTPGWSKTLPPVRDGYGDPIVPPQAVGGGWWNLAIPFTHKYEETDRVKKEGARLQAKLPQFPWTIGAKQRDDFDVRAPLPGDTLPVDLTAGQRDRWQQIYREIIRHPQYGIEKLLDSDQYKNATYAAQRNLFMDTLAAARTDSEKMMLTENADLANKVVNAHAQKYLPMIKPGDRPAAEAQIQESLDMLDGMLPDAQQNLMKWGFMGSGSDRDEAIVKHAIEGPTPGPTATEAPPAPGQ